MKTLLSRSKAALSLAEVMIASVVGGIGILVVFSGAMSMQRCFVASQDLVSAKKEQTRLSDYLAMDLRRAFTVTEGTDGTTIVTLTMADYYDASGSPRTPTITKYVHNYGDAAKPMTVVYTKKGGFVYRQENTAAPVEIAHDVEDFNLNIDDSGQLVQTQVTFQPRFQHNSTTADAAARKASSMNTTVILRNVRKDIK